MGGAGGNFQATVADDQWIDPLWLVTGQILPRQQTTLGLQVTDNRVGQRALVKVACAILCNLLECLGQFGLLEDSSNARGNTSVNLLAGRVEAWQALLDHAGVDRVQWKAFPGQADGRLEQLAC